MTVTPSPHEAWVWGHARQHEMHHKGAMRWPDGTVLPELSILGNCRSLIGGVPAEAKEAAARGEPLSGWCPHLNGTYDDLP